MSIGTFGQEGETARRGIKCAFASTVAKRRPETTGSFGIFAGATELCAAVKRIGPCAKNSVGHDESVHRDISTARTVRGDCCVFIWSRRNSAFRSREEGCSATMCGWTAAPRVKATGAERIASPFHG